MKGTLIYSFVNAPLISCLAMSFPVFKNPTHSIDFGYALNQLLETVLFITHLIKGGVVVYW